MQYNSKNYAFKKHIALAITIYISYWTRKLLDGIFKVGKYI